MKRGMIYTAEHCTALGSAHVVAVACGNGSGVMGTLSARDLPS